MSNLEFLTPCGTRFVNGSLYDPQTKDANGQPLVFKSGEDAGKPRVNYWVAAAIPKGAGQTHWAQSEWGAKIWQFGNALFPNGVAGRQDFAWKIVDGDSQIPNSKGRRLCDNEGYAGHWIINFGSSFKPAIVNNDGSKKLLEDNAVNPGDFIQVFSVITKNNSSQNPGLYLNIHIVSLTGYGERIIKGYDPETVGFGGVLPPGASATPISNFNPMTPAPAPLIPFTPPAQPVMPVTPTPSIMPHPAILTPKVLTPKAGTYTYEQLIQAGYTDALLIQNGMMLP